MIKPMTLIKGNDNLKKRLANDILNNKTSHAYILSGAKGSGRSTVALMFAAALECENKGMDGHALPCLECPSCKKILRGFSPDIYTIEKSGASVKIDQIRDLSKNVKFLPNELEHKFYIIKDAHTMTAEAQNAFLLTLEEPPSYVVFFLLCESEEKLLDTVKSRAPTLRTEPLQADAIKEHLLQASDDALKLYEENKEEFGGILSIANGSIGRALELIDEKTREPLIKQRSIAANLVEYALSKNAYKLTDLLFSLTPKQDEIIPVLNNAQSALRDLILLKKNENATLCFYSDREIAEEISYSTGISSIMSVYDKIENTKSILLRNAGVKLALTSLISNIL